MSQLVKIAPGVVFSSDVLGAELVRTYRPDDAGDVLSAAVPRQRCSSIAGGSSTTSAGRIARIATNLPPRSVEPGWIPIISTRDSLPDWSQNSASGHSGT